jgi:hypothetical protein
MQSSNNKHDSGSDSETGNFNGLVEYGLNGGGIEEEEKHELTHSNDDLEESSHRFKHIK